MKEEGVFASWVEEKIKARRWEDEVISSVRKGKK